MTRASRGAATTLLLSLILSGCGVFGMQAPMVPPGQSCQGLAVDLCQAELANAQANRPGQRIVAFHMRCTVPVCDARTGEAEVSIGWADGTSETYGTGWSGAGPAIPAPVQPAPALPVEPECVGVPQTWCFEMASAGVENAGGGPIVGIRIVCTRAAGCDDLVGDGDAIIRFEDGTETRSTWGYAD